MKTYRQSSSTNEKLQQLDPYNRLIARSSRVRLSAEQIRDQALAVSGLLSDKMYGKSVMPKQPPGIWLVPYSGAKWLTPKGEDQYRRAVYTYWRRSTPYPSMETFGTPSREFCKARRIRTNTPLQALVTLNDPVYMEAAQVFAKNIINHGGKSVEQRLEYAFISALSRSVKKNETARLKSMYEEEKAYFMKHPDDAKKLAPEGNSVESASWTMIANVIMNLDEFITRN